MRNDEPPMAPFQHLSRPRRAVRMAQAMEPVTVDSPIVGPPSRHRIGARSSGQSRMKSSIKHGHLRNRWQDFLDCSNALQAGRIVQRREFGQFTDRLLNLRGDPHRGSVTIAAVNNSMADNIYVIDSY